MLRLCGHMAAGAVMWNPCRAPAEVIAWFAESRSWHNTALLSSRWGKRRISYDTVNRLSGIQRSFALGDARSSSPARMQGVAPGRGDKILGLEPQASGSAVARRDRVKPRRNIDPARLVAAHLVTSLELHK